MTAKHLALFLGLIGSSALPITAHASGFWGQFYPAPYVMWVQASDGSAVLYDSADFSWAGDEECSRSWSDLCSVYILEADDELTDVTGIMAFVEWQDWRMLDWEVGDVEVHYYDVGPQWGGGDVCEDGQWSSDVDTVYDQYASSLIYGMAEQGDPSSSRGPFDYSDLTPVVRFDFTVELQIGWTSYDYTHAVEIWTDVSR